VNISATCRQNRSLQFRPIPFQCWCNFLRHSVDPANKEMQRELGNKVYLNVLTAHRHFVAALRISGRGAVITFMTSFA